MESLGEADVGKKYGESFIPIKVAPITSVLPIVWVAWTSWNGYEDSMSEVFSKVPQMESVTQSTNTECP